VLLFDEDACVKEYEQLFTLSEWTAMYVPLPMMPTPMDMLDMWYLNN